MPASGGGVLPEGYDVASTGDGPIKDLALGTFLDLNAASLSTANLARGQRQDANRSAPDGAGSSPADAGGSGRSSPVADRRSENSGPDATGDPHLGMAPAGAEENGADDAGGESRHGPAWRARLKALLLVVTVPVVSGNLVKRWRRSYLPSGQARAAGPAPVRFGRNRG
jgi:hypothetical protein